MPSSVPSVSIYSRAAHEIAVVDVTEDTVSAALSKFKKGDVSRSELDKCYFRWFLRFHKNEVELPEWAKECFEGHVVEMRTGELVTETSRSTGDGVVIHGFGGRVEEGDGGSTGHGRYRG
jgi:hypothetical protein